MKLATTNYPHISPSEPKPGNPRNPGGLQWPQELAAARLAVEQPSESFAAWSASREVQWSLTSPERPQLKAVASWLARRLVSRGAPWAWLRQRQLNSRSQGSP